LKSPKQNFIRAYLAAFWNNPTEGVRTIRHSIRTEWRFPAGMLVLMRKLVTIHRADPAPHPGYWTQRVVDSFIVPDTDEFGLGGDVKAELVTSFPA